MAEAKPARCPRCKAFTLVAERVGVRVAVDIAPADPVGFGVAASRGIDLYWVEKHPERLSRVLGRFQGNERPSWGPNGAQTGTQQLHVEHSCGAPARDQVVLSTQSPKGSAPAMPGAAAAGSHRPAVPAAGAPAPATPSPAPSATPHRSSRCDVCDAVVQLGELGVTSIECGTYAWAVHEECP